jgi:hypothetical protein
MLALSGHMSTPATLEVDGQPFFNPPQNTWAGLIQNIPVPITLTKMYGTLSFQGSSILIFQGTLTITAQLYKYVNSGGNGILTAVSGAVCNFAANGLSTPGFRSTVLVASMIASCSNTSFSVSFNPSDGAMWVITATGTGESGVSSLPVAINISMSLAQ